jgi:hypothetical protein
MKFKNLIMGAVLAVAAILPIASPPAVSAQSYIQESFLADGVTNVIVYSQSAFWTGYTGTNINGYISGIGTNVVLGTNAYYKNGVLLTNFNAFKSVVPLWVNRDGSIPSMAIGLYADSTNGWFTNRFQIRIAAVPFKPSYNYGSQNSSQPLIPTQPNHSLAANNIWTFTWDLTNTGNAFVLPGAGNTPVVYTMTTNVPTAFLQGAYGVTLLDIQPLFPGTNGNLRGLTLQGFAPNTQN